jgi:hypothetical protein
MRSESHRPAPSNAGIAPRLTSGILDSGRTDVKYEDWRGHKLDRAMLELLQEFRA